MPHGRAIAANLIFSNGQTLRVIGMYGVTGATSPDFASRPRLSIEAALNNFHDKQITKCTTHGWHSASAGDLNGFTNPALDRMGGETRIRTDSLAVRLRTSGAVDTFRHRHPDIKAYTHFHQSGTCSR